MKNRDAVVGLLPGRVNALSIEGRRIPKAGFEKLCDISRVLAAAREQLDQAEKDIEAAKTQAYDDAWLAVYEESVSQMALRIAEARTVSQDIYDGASEQIIDVAIAILRRIAPSLPVETLVVDLLMNALKELKAERFLMVSVNPKALPAVQERIEVWRASLSFPLIVQYQSKDELPLFACIVESEQGVVHAGLDEQLQLIERVLKKSEPHSRTG